MEKYEAILKTINDKIADCENLIEYYRGEVARIELFNTDLTKHLEQAEGKAYALAKEVEKLTKANEELKKANEALRKQANNF